MITKVHLEIVEHNFFHIKNQWILVGKGSLNLPSQLHQISKKDHQVIHWFIDDPESQMNDLNVKAMADRGFASGGHPPKLYIHVPKYARSHLAQVADWLTEMGVGGIRVICEKRGPFFKMGYHHDYNKDGFHEHGLYLNYQPDRRLISCEIYFGCSKDYCTGLNDYHTAKERERRARIVEPTKESRIANFKAKTPMVILKSFKDEEDIWKYLQAEEAAQQQVIRKKLTVLAANVEQQKNVMNAIVDTVAKTFHVPVTAMKQGEDDKIVRFTMDPNVILEEPKEDPNDQTHS